MDEHERTANEILEDFNKRVESLTLFGKFVFFLITPVIVVTFLIFVLWGFIKELGSKSS